MSETTTAFVEKIPDEAVISPKNFGGLKLVGYRVPPEFRTITKRDPFYVETYWTIDAPLDKTYSISAVAAPVREALMPPYKCDEHEFLNPACGVIYCEKLTLNPPAKNQIANMDLQIKINVLTDGQIIGEFKDPNIIKMKIPNLFFPCWNTEFDDVIYQSEPGKCWNAEQLAKVTGGKWIVPPPKGWYIKSFSLFDIMERPTLMIPTLFPGKDTKSFGARLLKNTDKVDGAITAYDIKGLPPNFPLLKVSDPFRAICELGFAARKRFQGKVIAVTGSNGKTTTCNMLSCVLGKDHKITASPGSSNVYRVLPWVFAHVNQDDAFAIIEIALTAFVKLQGSITYDITPNVAVITSIEPAHLSYNVIDSLKSLAEYKSKIFCGMAAGSYAVINRDMPHYEIAEEKAKSLRLNIISFGTHPDAFIRMPVLKDGGEFSVMGKTYRLDCAVPAEQLYDALAVIGVSIAVGVPIEKALEYLKTFTPIEGRGNILKVNRGGKNLKIIDSTFNANPTAMKYALEYLKTIAPDKKSRVAILGDIAELGDDEVKFHKGLAEPMLDAAPDRLLLFGELMHYPYEQIKDKLNVTWFKTLDELIKNFDSYLRDGDTVLVKSSHDTGSYKVVELLRAITPPAPRLNIPKPFFDVRNLLPEGITPEHNGRMPSDKLKKIHCGGYLYVDAARSWLAMVRAAAQDNIFLNVNEPFKTYRKIETQIGVFQKRFEPVENNLSGDAIRVAFDGKIWQLKPDAVYAAIPGTSSHGYGLAVDIGNSGNKDVKLWLDKNARLFGFVREYDFEYWHFTYLLGRKGISKLALAIENLPEPKYTAEQIQEVSGYKWFVSPPTDWACNGIISSQPFRAGCLAAVEQGDGAGISEQIIGKIFRQTAGLICVNPEPLLKFNRPLLVTPNLKDTIEKLSAFCVPEKFQIVRKS